MSVRHLALCVEGSEGHYSSEAIQKDHEFRELSRISDPKKLRSLLYALETEQNGFAQCRLLKSELLLSQEQDREEIVRTEHTSRVAINGYLEALLSRSLERWKSEMCSAELREQAEKALEEDHLNCIRKTNELIHYNQFIVPILKRLQMEINEMMIEEENDRKQIEVNAWNALWHHRQKFDPYLVMSTEVDLQWELFRESEERKTVRRNRLLNEANASAAACDLDAHYKGVMMLRNIAAEDEEQLWKHQQSSNSPQAQQLLVEQNKKMILERMLKNDMENRQSTLNHMEIAYRKLER
jgi:hypothetical protein